MRIIGIYIPYIEGSELLFVGQGVAAPHIVARGTFIYPFNRFFYRVIIFINQLNVAPGFHTLVRHTGLTAPYPDGIGGRRFKLLVNPVLQSVSGAEQDHQHKNSPGNAEPGQECPELVLPDGAEDLLPFIGIEHNRRKGFMG